MRPILSQQRQHAADIEQHQAALKAHRRIITRVVADELPGQKAVVTARCAPRFRGAVTAVSFSVGSFDFRGVIKADTHLHGDLAADLRARIAEARASHDRFVERLADVEAKASASLQRNGGMRLLRLEMDADWVVEPFDWWGRRLLLTYETLDADLEPEVDDLREFNARQFARQFRWIGKEHVRRTRARERLAAHGAAFKVDAPTENRLKALNQDLHEVGRAYLRSKGQPIDDEALRSGPSIQILEGRLAVDNMRHPGVRSRYVTFKELGVAG